MSGHRQQGSERAIVVGSADQFGALVVNSGRQFVRKHPAISLSWVVGLLVSILASGYKPSPEAVQSYEVKMANLNQNALAEAHEEMLYWDEIYRRSKGMFWTCNEECTYNKKQYEQRQRAYRDINEEYLKGVADAKSELGVFSEDGVEEARDLFWTKVSGGKQFAKRATMFNVFMGFGIRSGRDEGLAVVIARIVFRFVVNLTMGLFMAVFQFLFSVWNVIWSYQADPLSSVAFAAMASLGAISLLATWLLGMAAVGVTGIYAVGKIAETAQIEAARQGGQDPNRARYVQQQQHQHQQQQTRRRPAAATAPPAPSASSRWEHID